MNNKPQNQFTQNQVFENQFLNYLRQLAQEIESQNLQQQQQQQQPQLLQQIDIYQLKDKLVDKIHNFTPKLKYPIKAGINQILSKLNEFDNQILEIKKKLHIDENVNQNEDEEIQQVRRDYFQEDQKDELSRVKFELPQLPKKQEEDDEQDHFKFEQIGSNTFRFNYSIFQLRPKQLKESNFDVDGEEKQKISFYMIGQSQRQLCDLVKLDLLLKSQQNKLQDVKFLTLQSQNPNERSNLYSLYRYLISMKSNILFIRDFERQQKKNKQNQQVKKQTFKNSEVFEILDEAFQIALKNVNLQSLKIESQYSVKFEAFLSAMTNINLSLSNICFLELSIKKVEVEQQQISTFFSCLDELPYLQHLKITGLNIIEQEPFNTMNNLLKKLKYIQLSLKQLPSELNLQFNFQNAQFLILKIDLVETQLTKQQQISLFTSLSKAKNLFNSNLEVFHKGDELKNEEMQNKKNQKIKKDKKPKSNKSLRENPVNQEENYEKEEEELLQLLSEPNQLENYYINIKYNPFIYKVLLTQLKNSIKIKQINLDFQLQDQTEKSRKVNMEQNNSKKNNQDKQIDQECQNIDLQDLFAILQSNCNKHLEVLRLQHDCLSLNYAKIFEDMDYFKLDYSILPISKKNLKQILLFQNQFTFTLEKLKQIQISSPFDQENLNQIDLLCSSLCKSPYLKRLDLEFFDDYNVKICREKQNYNYPNVEFLKRLNSLKYLDDLSLNIPINQDILSSLECLLKSHQAIKYLKFVRNLYYYQVDTDYSQFFQVLRDCKSLIQINLNLRIEKINIYQEVQLESYEDSKINLFYKPLCDFIESEKGRVVYIKYPEEILNQKGIEMILNSLDKQKETIYINFQNKMLSQICKDSNLNKILSKCIQKGQLTHFQNMNIMAR